MSYGLESLSTEEGYEQISKRMENGTVPVKTAQIAQCEMVVTASGASEERNTVVTTNIYETVVIKRIRRFWNYKTSIKTVKALAISFGQTFGVPLSASEIALFNSICATDGNKFESRYNYVQTTETNLALIIRRLLSIFKSPIPDQEVIKLLARVQDCMEGAIAEMIPSCSAETHNQDAWTVMAQVFLATCGKDVPYVQVFAWFGSKSGAYKPNKYSEHNSRVIDELMTRFLFHQVELLFTCPAAPILPVESAPEGECHGWSMHDGKWVETKGKIAA
jgi:hypothetical protein